MHQGFLFFSLKILCDYISAFQTEKDRGFMVKNSYTSVSTFIKSMLNITIVFSREKHTSF